MEDINKFIAAVQTLKSDAQFIIRGDAPNSQETFDKVEWVTGEDSEKAAITTTTNPHSELTWTKVSAEMDRLQTEYDALDYARKREKEYPITKDFMEAYTEKEIGGDSTKWDAYVINYNKVRTENPK